MFSFDVSAIDIVLIIIVFILLLLHVTRKTETRTHVVRSRELQENSKANKIKKVRDETESQRDSHNCIHDLGYLKSLPPNTAVPDECFGCRKVMECLFPNK